MRNAERGAAERLDGRGLRIAVVQARFNVEVTGFVGDDAAPASAARHAQR